MTQFTFLTLDPCDSFFPPFPAPLVPAPKQSSSLLDSASRVSNRRFDVSSSHLSSTFSSLSNENSTSHEQISCETGVHVPVQYLFDLPRVRDVFANRTITNGLFVLVFMCTSVGLALYHPHEPIGAIIMFPAILFLTTVMVSHLVVSNGILFHTFTTFECGYLVFWFLIWLVNSIYEYIPEYETVGAGLSVTWYVIQCGTFLYCMGLLFISLVAVDSLTFFHRHTRLLAFSVFCLVAPWMYIRARFLNPTAVRARSICFGPSICTDTFRLRSDALITITAFFLRDVISLVIHWQQDRFLHVKSKIHMSLIDTTESNVFLGDIAEGAAQSSSANLPETSVLTISSRSEHSSCLDCVSCFDAGSAVHLQPRDDSSDQVASLQVSHPEQNQSSSVQLAVIPFEPESVLSSSSGDHMSQSSGHESPRRSASMLSSFSATVHPDSSTQVSSAETSIPSSSKIAFAESPQPTSSATPLPLGSSSSSCPASSLQLHLRSNFLSEIGGGQQVRESWPLLGHWPHHLWSFNGYRLLFVVALTFAVIVSSLNLIRTYSMLYVMFGLAGLMLFQLASLIDPVLFRLLTTSFEFWFLNIVAVIYLVVSVITSIYQRDAIAKFYDLDPILQLQSDILSHVYFFLGSMTLIVFDAFVSIRRRVKFVMCTLWVINSIRILYMNVFEIPHRSYYHPLRACFPLALNGVFHFGDATASDVRLNDRLSNLGECFSLLVIRLQAVVTLLLFCCKHTYSLLRHPRALIILRSSLTYQMVVLPGVASPASDDPVSESQARRSPSSVVTLPSEGAAASAAASSTSLQTNRLQIRSSDQLSSSGSHSSIPAFTSDHHQVASHPSSTSTHLMIEEVNDHH